MFHYQLHNPTLLYKAQNQHTILKKNMLEVPKYEHVSPKLIKENVFDCIPSQQL